MTNHDDSYPFFAVHSGYAIHDMAAFPVIQTGGRLVEKQNVRLDRQDGRQGNPLALPAAQGKGLLIPGKTEIRKHFVRSLPKRVFTIFLPDGTKPKENLIPHRVFADLPVRVLKEKSYLTGAFTDSCCRSILSADYHFAFCGLYQSVNQLHRGGLASSVCPQHSDKFAFFDVEGQIPNRCTLGGIIEAYVIQPYHCISPLTSFSASSRLTLTGRDFPSLSESSRVSSVTRGQLTPSASSSSERAKTSRVFPWRTILP